MILASRFSFQPIAVEEVATRLAELVGAEPAGRNLVPEDTYWDHDV